MAVTQRWPMLLPWWAAGPPVRLTPTSGVVARTARSAGSWWVRPSRLTGATQMTQMHPQCCMTHDTPHKRLPLVSCDHGMSALLARALVPSIGARCPQRAAQGLAWLWRPLRGSERFSRVLHLPQPLWRQLSCARRPQRLRGGRIDSVTEPVGRGVSLAPAVRHPLLQVPLDVLVLGIVNSRLANTLAGVVTRSGARSECQCQSTFVRQIPRPWPRTSPG